MPKAPRSGGKGRPTTRKGRAAKAAAKERKKQAEAKLPPRSGPLAHADDLAPRIGRPRFQPTDKDRLFVKEMAMRGATMEDMARVIGVERHTLSRYFKREIEDGRMEPTMSVVAALWRAATAKTVSGASVRAAEIWLRRFPEWLEAMRPKDHGDEAGAREIVVTGGLPDPGVKEIPTDADVQAGVRRLNGDGEGGG